jgi:hypothetical protein
MTHRYLFHDPITQVEVALVIPPDGVIFPMKGEAKIGVEHPGCAETADLCLDVDAFYCPRCRWSGRITGAWAVALIETSAPIAPPGGIVTVSTPLARVQLNLAHDELYDNCDCAPGNNFGLDDQVCDLHANDPLPAAANSGEGDDR